MNFSGLFFWLVSSPFLWVFYVEREFIDRYETCSFWTFNEYVGRYCTVFFSLNYLKNKRRLWCFFSKIDILIFRDTLCVFPPSILGEERSEFCYTSIVLHYNKDSKCSIKMLTTVFVYLLFPEESIRRLKLSGNMRSGMSVLTFQQCNIWYYLEVSYSMRWSGSNSTYSFWSNLPHTWCSPALALHFPI